MMRRSRYDTREESRETIIRGRYRESHDPKSLRSVARKKQPQNIPPQQNIPYRQSIFQQQRDERSTSSTEKSSIYNTDHSSHTQQTETRANLSKPSLFDIAESAGATLAAAAISPFDENRRGLGEHPRRSFFFEEEDDDDLRESPSDEMPLTVVEKAFDKVVDATCGNLTAMSGTQAASLLAKSYLKPEEEICCADGIVDPIILNPFEGLRSETRPIYEAASFPKVTFQEVKLNPKKTVASTAMQYPEPRRRMIKPKIPKTTPLTQTKTKSPIKSMVNRVKSVQNMLVRRRNRPVQESKTKKAELLERLGASNVDRYTRVRAHSDASDRSKGRAKHRRGGPLESHQSREDSTSSPTMALHECPSVRECPINERTNRARHNRYFRQPLQSDESYTSDPSLPPRLPLHRNRIRSEKPSDESSGAHHLRNGSFPSADEYSSGFESSVDPYSSVEKCSSSTSSSSSLSNDLIPKVDDYILPSGEQKAQPDLKQEASILFQHHATEVERIPIIRRRQIQSDPTTKVGEIGTRPDPPTAQNETSASRKSIKRRRAASQPNPYSHYERMAKLFVPVLYRVLSRCQRKCLPFQQETETAIVPRWSASQEYMLSELVNAAVHLMQQYNREGIKKLSKESRRSRRRRRRKRSSVLDELCNQISVLDQKLLEITNETVANESAVIIDEDPFVEDEGPSFIEEIDDWSDDEIPPEVGGIFDETNHPELFDIAADVGGSLDEMNRQEFFGGLQSNDPEFKDLIEMAYVVTDLSRDQFIDAHQIDSLEDNEDDDDMEQELTNLSFVEEIIQTELSQVDSGEGTHKDESVCEEFIQGQLFQGSSGEGTFQDESFTEETVSTEVSQVDEGKGAQQDDSVEITDTEIPPLGPEEGSFHEIHAKGESCDAEASDDGLIEEIFEEEPLVAQNIVAEASQFGSVNWGDESLAEELTMESVTHNARPVKRTHQEESVTDKQVQLGLEPQVTNDVSQLVVEGGIRKVAKKMQVEAAKKSVWEDDMAEEVTMESVTHNDCPVKRTHQEESATDEQVRLRLEPQVTNDVSQLVVEGGISKVAKKMQVKAVKKLLWEDDMFPDDELHEDSNMFPDDEMNVLDQKAHEMHEFDQSVTIAVPIIETCKLENKPEEGLGLSEDAESSFSDLQSVPSDEKEAFTAKVSQRSDKRFKSIAPATRKVRSSLQSTTVTASAEAKHGKFGSRLSVLSHFNNQNQERKEIFDAEDAYVPRVNQAETLSIDVDYTQRKKEAVLLELPVTSPSSKTQDDVSVDSTPSDEASEGIKETGSMDGSEVANDGKPEMPEESHRDALTASVVEDSMDEKNPAVEIIVASTSPELDSKETAQLLDTAPSCETEESDPICAAVNRKLAEVRQNNIPDPDDEMIMETIMETMNPISKTPIPTASGAVPDPEDSMIIESLSPRIDSMKVKNEAKTGLDDISGNFSRKSTENVESGAGSPIVMETVYLAESEMVTEKLYTVPEEGSSCNASMQGSTGKETNHMRKGRQNSASGKVRQAIMKFNGAGSSPCSSPEQTDVVLDIKCGVQNTQSQSQKDKASTGSKGVQDSRPQSKPYDSTTKGNAAALIARFEAKVSPTNAPRNHPADELHFDGDVLDSGVPATSAKPSSDVNIRGEIDAAIEHSESSTTNIPSPLVAEPKIEGSSPSDKSSSQPTHQAFYDQIPNLLSQSSGSHLEASKRRRSREYSSLSKIDSTLQQVNGGEALNFSSKHESKQRSKVNQLRSQFETNISMKESSSIDQEGPREVASVGQNVPKTDAKVQSKTPSRKQLPLHGFVKARSKKDGPKPETLIDKVKPPVHKPSKNFSPGPIDFEALNESLLQIRQEEMMEQDEEVRGQEIEKDEAGDDESSKLPIAELQLKEVSSLVSELEGPKVKMFSGGMCHCLPVGRNNSDDNNSVVQLKKVGRSKNIQTPTQKEESNHEELVPPEFSMDAMLDDNMQRTADAAVKALELVLTQGAANAAAAITQNDSQVSCFHECITPVTEGSFNAFSQAVTRKSAKKMMIPKNDDDTLTLDDNKSKGKQATKKVPKAKFMSPVPAQPSHPKESSKEASPLNNVNINENDDNDDWARLAIEENNVEDLIEALRSESSGLDPFMNVSLAPSTPATDQGHLLRVDATVSPMSSEWAGSIARLGAQPLSAAQRDEWSKRNLLSGTTTLSSEDDSEYNWQQHSLQRSQDGEAFDERKVDIDFHYESPAGSIRGPYDGMLKEQQKNRRGLPPRAKRSQKRSMDPPIGRFYQDEDVSSTGKREEATSFDKDYIHYTYKDRRGNVTKPQNEHQPDYYDFPAPPSQQFDSEVSELTMSQEGSMTRSMKSQDPEQAFRSFQEMENRKRSSSDWLYGGKRETATTVPCSPSARTKSTRTKGTVVAVGTNNDRRSSASSSSMWCSSESFGMMIQDCFATAPSQQPEAATKAIKDVPETTCLPKRDLASTPPTPTDAPSLPGGKHQELIGSPTPTDSRMYF